MTTFEKIITAIQPFGYPYAQDVYVGESDHWFTYNYVSDYGDLYSDDEPAEIVVSVQVHLYLPLQEEFIELKNRVRRAIYAQGFTLPQITFQMTEDKVYRHMIFTCNIEEEE